MPRPSPRHLHRSRDKPAPKHCKAAARRRHPAPIRPGRARAAAMLAVGVVGLLVLTSGVDLPGHRAAALRQEQAAWSARCDDAYLARHRNARHHCNEVPRSHPLPTVTLPTTTVPASMSTTTMSTTIAPSTSTTQTVSPPSTSTSASDGPNRSGLAWSSGAYGDDEAGFAVWRGRPLDNTTIWPNRSSWQEISHPDIYRAVSATPKEIDLTLGLAMLPDPANGASFAQCASGAYDQYYRTYGSELVRLGRADSVIRLGWEANGDWYSWSIRSDVANYKACFRRQVAAIRSTDPRARIDWNMNKDSHMDVSVVQAYPGDDVVDIVGVDFYDMWPAYAGLAAWTADYMSTQKGGPRGLGAWLAFAKQHGKLLSVPEWGTTPAADGGGEHPVYIQAMHDFFAAHADDLAYETYFNRHPGFQLWPSTLYPRSAAEYRARY